MIDEAPRSRFYIMLKRLWLKKAFDLARDCEGRTMGDEDKPQPCPGFESVSTRSGLAGWVSQDLPGVLFEKFLDDPEAFIDVPQAQVLKHKRKTKVIRQTLRDGKGCATDVVVKRVAYTSIFRRIGFLLLLSPALRSLKGALILRAKGFHTPEPLAAMDGQRWKNLGTSYFLSREIKAGQSFDDLWDLCLRRTSRERSLNKRRKMLREAALLLHKLHSRGVYHRDLKGANILMQGGNDSDFKLFLVDVADVRTPWYLFRRRKIRNLVQMCRMTGKAWQDRERVLFLKWYADLCRLSKMDRRSLVKNVLERIPRDARD